MAEISYSLRTEHTAIASLLLIADREGVDISDSGAVTTWILDQCGVQPREVRELCTFFTWSRGLDNLAGMTPLHEVCQSDGRACPLGVTCPIRDRVLGRRSREQTCREE